MMSIVVPSERRKVESVQDEATSALAGKVGDCVALCLKGNSYSKGFCESLGSILPNMPGLKKLDVSDIFVGRLKDQIPASILSLAKGLIPLTLQELDISHNAVNPFGAKSLSTFLSHPNPLKKLFIDNCGLGIDGVREITDGLASGCHELEVFSIGRNRVENTGAIMVGEILGRLPKMRELSIFQNNIRLEGMNALLEGVLQCQYFSTLDIQDNFLQEGSVSLLSQVLTLLKIQTLNLSDCNIKEHYNEAIITAISKCESLVQLGYNYNELTGEQALRLAVFLSKMPMVRFDVKGNQLKKKTRAEIKGLVKGQVILASDDEEEDLAKELSRLKV